MINPDGSPGTAFTKSATTRFMNSQVNAQRSTMPLNEAAQMSLREQTQAVSSNRPEAPVGPKSNPVDFITQQKAPTGYGSVGLPSQASEVPEQNPVGAIQNDLIDNLIGTIRTEKFINSPRVKDAATTVRLKNFFNNSNPDRVPDNRNLLDRVIARIGIK